MSCQTLLSCHCFLATRPFFRALLMSAGQRDGEMSCRRWDRQWHALQSKGQLSSAPSQPCKLPIHPHTFTNTNQKGALRNTCRIHRDALIHRNSKTAPSIHGKAPNLVAQMLLKVMKKGSQFQPEFIYATTFRAKIFLKKMLLKRLKKGKLVSTAQKSYSINFWNKILLFEFLIG